MPQRNRLRNVLFIVFFLTGSAGLICEIVWTRLLTLAFGSTVFAISTVLVSFTAGLAAGAFLFGRVCDRVAHPLRLYALLEGGVALTALLMPFVMRSTEFLYVQI